MKPITVLSMFDGMSCGQIALQKMGLPVRKYYASEIDKHAIKVTQANFPDTVQLGDCTDQAFMNWVNAMADKGGIDMLMAGSPCQGFSRVGSRLDFQDPRSKLFWVFVRVLKKLKPKYFLLENVRMKQENLDIISEALGVEPVLINSSLVSAQNRERYYWTNIPLESLPGNKGIVIKDILDDEVDERLTGFWANTSKTGMKLAGHATELKGHDYNRRVYCPSGKSPTLCASSGGNLEPKIITKVRGSGDKLEWRKLSPLECERLQTVPDNYTSHVSKSQRYRMLGNGWTVDVIAHLLKGAM